MKKIFTVAKWEFVEKIKTKTFIISLIITPLIIIGFSLGPTLIISNQEDENTKVIGIVDTSEIYSVPMKNKLGKYKTNRGQPVYVLIDLTDNNLDFDKQKQFADNKILSNYIEGYILITNGGTDSVEIQYRNKTAGNFRDAERFEDEFNQTRLQLMLISQGINSEILDLVSDKVNIKSIKIEEEGKESKSDFLIIFFSSFIFILLLMMMVIYSGQMLVRSLIEEKSNRLIEIIISSCTGNQLLTGKILGLSALFLSQIFIWGLIGIFLTGAALIPPDVFKNLIPILIYFVLGFIFYSAIFVGIGAIVSTEQEAQQITSYLSMILVLPVIFAFAAIENPQASFVYILSYIPFTLPSIMILRLNISSVPVWEVASTLIIMFCSIIIAISLSAKIFRIGILSYGKRPSLKELGQWLKEK